MPEKPKLRAITIPVFRVHYQDLERYIQQVFGFEYNFFFATGLVNGMCPEYQVTGVIPSTMAKQVQDLQRGQRTRNVSLILNALATEGYIPPGKYIINTHQRPEPGEVYRALLLKTQDPEAPECLQFKAAHKDDGEVMKRIAILDQAILDQSKRARR